MRATAFNVRHVHNARSSSSVPYGPEQRRILNAEAFAEAKAEITSWPGYAPTPLIALPALADHLGIAELTYKDEGQRFGLLSFKALGGAYAVLRILQAHLREKHRLSATSAQELTAGKHRAHTRHVTVACATDGNHGRSVAWGARMFGCRCVVYLYAHVSRRREQEIEDYGADIVRVHGTYDDSVRQCAADARKNGWHLVADTAADGEAAVPSMVMQGYALLIDEVYRQREGLPQITHVFLPGGVGGLAAAIGGYLWERFGPQRPRIVVVEPMRADCLYRAIAAGEPVPVPGAISTFMACLAAGEVSPAAWPILKTAIDDVLALPDEAAAETMRLLAQGCDADTPIVAGESGCAATAGLIAASLDGPVRSAIGLSGTSRVLVIGSEGATDPDTYQRTVGESAESVSRRRK